MKFIKRNKFTIDKEIDNLLQKMSGLDPVSEEYKILAENVERLAKAKSYDKQRYFDKTTMLYVAGNLMGIAMIVGYEKAGVVTSKALGFVLKGRP